jgi:hypothetical protein
MYYYLPIGRHSTYFFIFYSSNNTSFIHSQSDNYYTINSTIVIVSKVPKVPILYTSRFRTFRVIPECLMVAGSLGPNSLPNKSGISSLHGRRRSNWVALKWAIFKMFRKSIRKSMHLSTICIIQVRSKLLVLRTLGKVPRYWILYPCIPTAVPSYLIKVINPSRSRPVYRDESNPPRVLSVYL